MKLRCDCDQDYVYDHTKAGQQFKCRWCGQLLVMPRFEALSPEDQAYYRDELRKQQEKAKRVAEKAKRREQLAAEKHAAQIQKQQQKELELRERAKADEAVRLRRAEQDERYAEAIAEAKSEPDRPKVWFCYTNGTEHGPMQDAMVQKWIDDGTLGPRDYLRVENSATWVFASDIPERFHFPSTPTVKCPKCGCTQLSANKKGMDPGSACCGALLLGPLGLLCGLSGSSQVIVTCLKCGHHWTRG